MLSNFLAIIRDDLRIEVINAVTGEIVGTGTKHELLATLTESQLKMEVVGWDGDEFNGYTKICIYADFYHRATYVT